MTKKLQSSLSLRSLLFGGPHLDSTVDLSMEECIHRLRTMEASQNMGGYVCSPVEFNDLGRMVRWRFHVEVQVSESGGTTQIPIKGSFALRSNGQINIKARIGPDARGIFGILIAGITLIMGLLILPGLYGLPVILTRLIGASSMETGITVLVILLVIFLGVMLVIWLRFSLPYFPSSAFISHLLYHLRDTLFYRPPEAPETAS